MKRVLSLILAISMVMSMFTFSFAGTSLKDVNGTEYQAAVEALVELGIVNGYEDGTYRPEQNVSRAEMAKLLVIAAGLEAAAELNEGATRFADVNGGWASGYINVAAEYGYIMGDPDGNFRPDDTVSYAEAVTMALRVLGYKSVIEAKGTWPTNYIAKAEDLDMLEDITYGNYAEGAKRGNVAILMWNMLRTDMWSVYGESDGDGLHYNDKNGAMLNIKFKDYRYSVAEFDSFSINNDGEVLVDLVATEDSEESFVPGEYEYFKNDFYTFVKGSEVEVLVNLKDETVLTMVRTGNDKLVEGIKLDIDEDYEEISADLYLYAYALVERKAITAATEISGESTYVYEVSTSNKNYIKFNDDRDLKFDYDDMETEIILKDGERATIKDVEVGDVLTKVSVATRSGNEMSEVETFYMIGATEVEGKLTKVVVDYFDNPDAPYITATIAKEEYPVAEEAKYVVDPEDMDDVEDFDDDAYEDDMNGEEVVAVLDVFGRVTMVLFDGKIDAGEGGDELTAKFVTIAGPVERDGDYTLPVITEDGEDTLVFASKTLGNEFWRLDEELEGYFALVTLNEDGEIEAFADLAETEFEMFSFRESGDIMSNESGEYVYDLGDDDEVGGTGGDADEVYEVIYGLATYSKDDKALIIEDNEYDVGSSTIVVTLVFDDKGTTKTSDDEYRVTYTEGIDEIDRLDDDNAVIIMDKATKLGDAKYVVIFDEVATGEDNLIGILSAVEENRIGELLLTITETRITDSKELKEAKKDAMILNTADTNSAIVDAIKGEGTEEVVFVLYSTEVNKNDELEVVVHDVINDYELNLDEEASRHPYIPTEDEDGEVSADGKKAVITYSGDTDILDLTDEEVELFGTKYEFEDYRYILIEVELDDEDENNETQYVIDSYEEVAFEDITIEEADRISIRTYEDEVVIIIRGLPARTE